MALFLDIRKFFTLLYEKLVKINDSPHKVAFGFALGVFMGILPGVGPLASLALAFLFKVNRVAALMGSLLTNTWFSVMSFLLAVKIGAMICSLRWEGIYSQCKAILEDFYWKKLLDIPFLEIVFPLILGYAVIGVISGIVTYGVVMAFLRYKGARN